MGRRASPLMQTSDPAYYTDPTVSTIVKSRCSKPEISNVTWSDPPIIGSIAAQMTMLGSSLSEPCIPLWRNPCAPPAARKVANASSRKWMASAVIDFLLSGRDDAWTTSKHERIFSSKENRPVGRLRVTASRALRNMTGSSLCAFMVLQISVKSILQSYARHT